MGTNHPHGPCQCADHSCHGPAAFAVIREGKLIRVCPTCVGATDHVIRILPAPHEMDVYMAWDPFTGRHLERMLVRTLKVN